MSDSNTKQDVVIKTAPPRPLTAMELLQLKRPLTDKEVAVVRSYNERLAKRLAEVGASVQTTNPHPKSLVKLADTFAKDFDEENDTDQDNKSKSFNPMDVPVGSLSRGISDWKKQEALPVNGQRDLSGGGRKKKNDGAKNRKNKNN